MRAILELEACYSMLDVNVLRASSRLIPGNLVMTPVLMSVASGQERK